MENQIIDSFMGEYRWLSNYHYCTIVYDNITYPSTEHAYQALKSLNNKDRMRIAALPTPKEAKQAGFTVELRPNWDNIKLSIMEEVLRLKFAHPDLKQKLLDTGDATLIEGNYWHDNFFGVCTCDNCKNKIKNNNLGKLLMEIREELKEKNPE